MRISDWSSDVCSSDLVPGRRRGALPGCRRRRLQRRSTSQPASRGAAGIASSDRAFQADFQQLIRLHRELHRQLAQDLLAEAVDDQADRVFLPDTSAAAIATLVAGVLSIW